MMVTRSGAVEILDILTMIVGTRVSMRVIGATCLHVSALDRNQESNIGALTLLSSTHAREIKWVPWMDVMEDTV